MTVVSLILFNFILLVGAYAFISWLLGEDVLRPIRVEQKDRIGRR